MNRTSLGELLALAQPGHSDFQMHCFVTAKTGGTTYGMFKQALRELIVRVRAARDQMLEMEELRDDLMDERLKGVPRLRKMCSLSDVEGMHKTTLHELSVFLGQARTLRTKLPKTLDVRTLDRLEREMWVHNVKRRAAIEIRVANGVSVATMESILALPKTDRESIIEQIEGSVDELIAWSRDCGIDEVQWSPAVLTTDEVKELRQIEVKELTA